MGWERKLTFNMPAFQWNVCLADVGFVEGEGAKIRPVLVMNEPIGAHKIVIVAPIYSVKSTHSLTGDVKIKNSQSAMGLIKPSTIRLHRMVALPASDLKERIGHASIQIQVRLKEGLKELFKL